MALSTGKCLENAMCKVDLPFIVSFQRFLLDFFVDSYQVLSIHLREGERNYALNKRRYFPFSSLSASPTSIVRPWWLTSRSSSFLIHNQHLDQMTHHRGEQKWLKNGNGRFHSCDLGTGGNEKHRKWQENKKPIPNFLENICLKFTRIIVDFIPSKGQKRKWKAIIILRKSAKQLSGHSFYCRYLDSLIRKRVKHHFQT